MLLPYLAKQVSSNWAPAPPLPPPCAQAPRAIGARRLQTRELLARVPGAVRAAPRPGGVLSAGGGPGGLGAPLLPARMGGVWVPRLVRARSTGEGRASAEPARPPSRVPALAFWGNRSIGEVTRRAHRLEDPWRGEGRPRAGLPGCWGAIGSPVLSRSSAHYLGEVNLLTHRKPL